MATIRSQTTLSQAASLKPRFQRLPQLLILLGMLICLGMAAWSYYEVTRQEPVVVLIRSVAAGQQIQAADLGTVQLSRYRPAELVGIGDPQLAIGQWATRQLQPNDLLQASMIQATPPDRPTYPNGRMLEPGMVAFPFPLAGVGPLHDHDRLNIGFSASNPALCQNPTAGDSAGSGAYACRFLSGISILYIDQEVAYIQLHPYQAHALRALQANGANLWGERYGSTSPTLPTLDRLSGEQIDPQQLATPTQP
jgi:hypothetical protein